MRITFFNGTEIQEIAQLPVILRGEQGERGPEGKTAYEVAVDEGFTGSEVEWLLSLVGPQGERGPAGEAIVGPKGDKGDVGPQGLTVRGVWNQSTAYAPNDVVRYNSALYIARGTVSAGTPNPVTASVLWGMILQDGANGQSVTITTFSSRTAYDAYVPGDQELAIYVGA